MISDTGIADTMKPLRLDDGHDLPRLLQFHSGEKETRFRRSEYWALYRSPIGPPHTGCGHSSRNARQMIHAVIG